MIKIARWGLAIVLAALLSVSAVSACATIEPGRTFGPNTPPIWPNSIASTCWDLIRGSDPDARTNYIYIGQRRREMPPSLNNPDVHFQMAYVWRQEFSDSKFIDIIMTEDYGSVSAAAADAREYARRLGKLPAFMRQNIAYIVGHVGDSNFYAESAAHFFVIFSERAKTRIANNDLEESFFHEAVHAALQQDDGGLGIPIFQAPGWARAGEGDNAYITEYAEMGGGQEDFAESALFGYAMLYYPERFTAEERNAIQQQIPRRLNFWRNVFMSRM